MNFGQNMLNLFLDNAQPIVLVAIIIIGIVLIYKRKLTELVAFVFVAIIAVGFVFNASGTKDAMLGVYNRVVTGGAALGIMSRMAF